MLRLSRVLATTAATLSLIGLAAFPASADPTPAPKVETNQTATPRTVTPNSVGNGTSGTLQASDGEYNFAKQVHDATDPAHTNSSGQIDWNWVQDAFAGSPISKNGFGAGWWSRTGDWSKFTHLSSNDKKGIIDWGKTHDGPNPSLTNSALMRPNAPKPCEGVTQLTSNSASWYDYLNSCDTAKFIAKSTACAAIAGLGGAILGVVTKGATALPTAVALVLCAGNLAWLAYAKDQSTIAAVVIRVDRTLVKNSDGYQVPYGIYPQ